MTPAPPPFVLSEVEGRAAGDAPGARASTGRLRPVYPERLPWQAVEGLSTNGCGSEPPCKDAGFTLIEALVALAIVAIAAAGLIGATERHVDTVAGLERRTVARWVAENRLAELALAGEGPAAAGEGQVEMLGQQWQVATTARTSADPDLRLVEVAVGPVGAAPVVRLKGFVDRGARP